MEFLRLLESIRNPAATAFFSAVTYCGDQIFFMVIAVTVMWCFRKRDGYYILFVGFLGMVLNQFLKLWFRIPRPWILDPGFTIVESARAAAGGYSFPSGHTQNIVGTMTCVFLITDRKWIRAAAAALILLVPFSRMYLGCHTPLDVGVSFVLALVLAASLWPLVRRYGETPQFLWGLIGTSALLCAFYWCFVTFYRFPADIDPENLREGTKNAYTLAGCLTGLVAAKLLDDRYIHYPVKAVWQAQILKVALGLGFLVLLKIALKAPLRAIMGEYPADMIRYGLMVFFAGAIWPTSFTKFSRRP